LGEEAQHGQSLVNIGRINEERCDAIADTRAGQSILRSWSPVDINNNANLVLLGQVDSSDNSRPSIGVDLVGSVSA
jgi:hypothetical protein